MKRNEAVGIITRKDLTNITRDHAHQFEATIRTNNSVRYILPTNCEVGTGKSQEQKGLSAAQQKI